MAQSSHPCFISGSISFIIKTKRIKRNRETIWIFGILCYTVFDGFFEKVKQWITVKFLRRKRFIHIPFHLIKSIFQKNIEVSENI